MSSDGFTKALFQWLDQVARDRALKPSAFLVAYTIGRHINRKTRTAWPSQAVLAQSSGLTVRSVQTCLHDLSALGHLQIASGRGRRIVSQYRTILMRDEKANAASTYAPNNTKPASLFAPTETTKPNSSFATRCDTKNTKSSVGKGEKKRNKTRSLLPTEPFEEPSEEPFEFLAPKKHKSLPRRNLTLIDATFPNGSDSEQAATYLKSKGRDDLANNVEEIASRFRDYHTSKGNRFVDWRATWRNWVRREIVFTKRPIEASATGSLSAARGVMRGLGFNDGE